MEFMNKPKAAFVATQDWMPTTIMIARNNLNTLSTDI